MTFTVMPSATRSSVKSRAVSVRSSGRTTLLARLGGDEFGVILDARFAGMDTGQAAAHLARRIIDRRSAADQRVLRSMSRSAPASGSRSARRTGQIQKRFSAPPTWPCIVPSKTVEAIPLLPAKHGSGPAAPRRHWRRTSDRRSPAKKSSPHYQPLMQARREPPRRLRDSGAVASSPERETCRQTRSSRSSRGLASSASSPTLSCAALVLTRGAGRQKSRSRSTSRQCILAIPCCR